MKAAAAARLIRRIDHPVLPSQITPVPTPQSLPRVAVITTELGVRSEVWILRQLAAFTRVQPVLFGWADAENPLPMPSGLEVRRFSQGNTRKPGRLQRLCRRLGLAAGYLPDAATRRAIPGELAEARIDAVLCHFAWNAIPVAGALDGALPIVAQVHGRDVSALLEQPAYRAALRRTLPRIDHLVAVGSFQLRRLQSLGLRPEHSLIPCGAPTALFGRNPLPQRLPGQPIRFISVGRVSHEKGVLESLRAFELLHAQHPASELVFVGHGPAEAELAAAIAASPAAGAVRRTGYMSPEQLAALLASCHVLLQHSREIGGWIEGFGVTLTEGGAAGLPLVASSSGGIPDQVHDGVNGFLFQQGDIESQAGAMARLATDEPLRLRMGAAAREVAQGYDADLMAIRIEDILLAQLARSG